MHFCKKVLGKNLPGADNPQGRTSRSMKVRYRVNMNEFMLGTNSSLAKRWKNIQAGDDEEALRKARQVIHEFNRTSRYYRRELTKLTKIVKQQSREESHDIPLN